MRRNHLGTAGQYLSILIFGVALGFGISKGLNVYWALVAFGSVVWGLSTKIKGY